MRKLASALLICAAVISTPAMAENIIGDTAVLRALDKVTATTQDFRVKVGDTLQYGSLEVAVKHCEKNPPEETPETYVFVQVTDTSIQRVESQNELDAEDQSDTIFSGWMFGSNPALSSLEHPVYDVWPIGCRAPSGLRGTQ